MNECWKKVTLVTIDDKPNIDAWINLSCIPIIMPFEGGSKLEISHNFVCVCVESPEYLMAPDIPSQESNE